MIPMIGHSGKGTAVETGRRSVVAWGWRWGKMNESSEQRGFLGQ